MPKRIVLFSALLSLLFALGCAEVKEAIKDITHPKSEEAPKKAKSKTPTETPKEATSQKQPETTASPKDSAPAVSETPVQKSQDTTTKSKATSTKKPATSSESSGSVFGPK
jgi:hypothetical protein